MENLAPTPERLSRVEYEAPHRDQQTSRTAYRVLSPFETLLKRGEIDLEQARAADKLTMHYHGSMRHDVRVTDIWTESNATNEGIEYPQFYHGQKLADAKRHLMPSEWHALRDMIDETATLAEIGRRRRHVKNADMARAQGLTVVGTALERLAYHWGLKARPPIR